MYVHFQTNRLSTIVKQVPFVSRPFCLLTNPHDSTQVPWLLIRLRIKSPLKNWGLLPASPNKPDDRHQGPYSASKRNQLTRILSNFHLFITSSTYASKNDSPCLHLVITFHHHHSHGGRYPARGTGLAEIWEVKARVKCDETPISRTSSGRLGR